jgi:predicted small lipoprotein YifL
MTANRAILDVSDRPDGVDGRSQDPLPETLATTGGKGPKYLLVSAKLFTFEQAPQETMRTSQFRV